MNPKINGLMSDALNRVLGGAARTANSSNTAKRPARQGAPSCESLEGRVVLSNFGGADLLGSLSQIGVVTTVMDAGGPPGGLSQADAGSTQTSQADTGWQALQTKIQGLAAKSEVTIADLSALSSDSQAIATAGGGLKVESLQTVLGSLATAVAGGADTTQAQADFNALFSGSKVDQATIDKTFTDLVQTIKDSKITTTDLTDFATTQAAVAPGSMGSTTMPGMPGAPGWVNGAGPGGDALTASLANAGVMALPTARPATAVTTASAALPAGQLATTTAAAAAGGAQVGQLQTDLDKLRTDQQTVTAKSAVTSDDLDQLKTDSQNITTAGFNFDPKSLQTAVNGLVASVAGGADTTQVQADFNALFSGSSVTQTVIDKTFTDMVQTIKDSNITAADATLIATDQTAVQADFAALPQGGPGFGSGGMPGQGWTMSQGGMGGPVAIPVHGSAPMSGVAGGTVTAIGAVNPGSIPGGGSAVTTSATSDRGASAGGGSGATTATASNPAGPTGDAPSLTAAPGDVTSLTRVGPGGRRGMITMRGRGVGGMTGQGGTVATPARGTASVSGAIGGTTTAANDASVSEVGGGPMRGASRSQMGGGTAGRFGRSTTGGLGGGGQVQDLNSGTGRQDRSMSRFTRR